MSKHLAQVLAIAVLVVVTATATQAQLTPGPLYDFRASNNPAHPDAFENLGEIGGELGVVDLAPQLGFDTFDFYNVQAGDGSFDILTGGDDVIIEDGFTYEMLLRRTGEGVDSGTNEHQIAAIAEGGDNEIFLFVGTKSDDPAGVDFGDTPNIFTLPEGEWTHFVLTVDDVMDEAKVYVNGGAPTTFPFAGEYNENPANDVTLFKTRGGESAIRRFDGDISETRLYDFVLTDEQALANYTATVVPQLPLPPSSVGGRDTIGSQPVGGSFANQVFTDPEGSEPGLAQSWYGSSGPTGRNRDQSKAGVDTGAQLNDRAIPMFHGEDGTWWTGNHIVTDVQNYPTTDLDGVIETEGGNEGLDFYYAKLEGEILIPESGTIRFVDGVDDYAYLAIDTDRSGVAGDSESEVLLNDDDWTDALAQAPPADDGDPPPPIVEVNFEGIADGGEWLAIEFNMLERDGGDAGMLYWDALDEDGNFPTVTGGAGGVDDEDAASLQVPDTHLRGPTTAAMHVSSDVAGTVPERSLGWEIDVDPADGTSDTFEIEDLGEGREEIDSGDLTTIIDVEGAELHINALGEVSEGDSFQVFVDQVSGTPIIATEGWSFDASTGSVVFGISLECDINGDGVCDAGDIDAMTQRVMDGEATQADRKALIDSPFPAGLNSWVGDSDENGQFDEQDFVKVFIEGKYLTGEKAGYVEGDWDGNFVADEQDFVAAFIAGGYLKGQRGAAAVPEPSSLVLLALGMLAVMRRRR